MNGHGPLLRGPRTRASLFCASAFVLAARRAHAHDTPTVALRFDALALASGSASPAGVVVVSQSSGPQVLVSFTLPPSCVRAVGGSAAPVDLGRELPLTLHCGPSWTHEPLVFTGLGAHAQAIVARLEGSLSTARVVRTVFPDDPTLRFEEGQPGSPFSSHFKAGAHHVATGLDHLALVALIVVASARLRDAMAALLGFTMAHALTLGLAAYGHPVMPPRLAELLVAASLVFASQFSPKESLRRRLGTVFAFGLVHGVAFLEGAAPILRHAPSPLLTLAAFHLGIECVQIACTAGIALALFQVRKWPRSEALLRRALALLCGGYGVALFFARLA